MRFGALSAACGLAALVSAAPYNDTCPGEDDTSLTEITVRADIKHQHIEGFGFSGAFQRAQLLLNITEQNQQELLDLLYSTETGIGFSILRNGIGSSNSSYNDCM